MAGAGYERQESELANLKYRRSLYFIEDLVQGSVIEEKHIRSIRPGFGIAPKHYDQVLGKILSKSVVRGTPVSWEQFDD